jgi:hypothetical protein
VPARQIRIEATVVVQSGPNFDGGCNDYGYQPDYGLCDVALGVALGLSTV